MLYHVNQIKGDEPYIDAVFPDPGDMGREEFERKEGTTLLTEEEMQAHPMLSKALEEWRQGDDRIRMRGECAWFLATISEALPCGIETMPDGHELLLEDAKRLEGEEPACRAAIEAASLLRQLGKVLNEAPPAEWPDLLPSALVRPETDPRDQ